MASTSKTATSRSSRSLKQLQSRARDAKKARALLSSGKSLGEVHKQTGIPRSTLQGIRTSLVWAINNKQEKRFFTRDERQRIIIHVLGYVHKQLLRKPKCYLRRPSKSNEANRAVVSYKEVREYLELNWKTAHPDKQEGLQDVTWIPGERSYHYLVKKIPSSSNARRRQRRLRAKTS
jgi:hypothetical protein